MPEIHLLTGAYAADALDDAERAGFERHLRTCDSCVIEVGEFHEAAVLLAQRVAATPPEGLRSRVLRDVIRTRQLAPATHRPLPRPSLRRTIAVAAAAVLVAGGAGLGGIAWQSHQAAQEAQAQAAAMARVMADPSRVQSDGIATAGGSATVVAASGQAVFSADRLPALSPGRVYQLWLIDAAGVHSAGVLELQNGSGQELVDDVQRGSSLAVSVEPEGGSKQPTTQPILKLDVA